MKNEERGVETKISNGPLMATRVQAWDRHCAPGTWNVDHTTNIKCKVFRRKLTFLFIETWPEETRNNIKVKTPLSASSDYVGAMNVQQQNLNTVKSLLRQFFVKRSLRKLNQITKKKSRFSNIIEWKTPSDHWRGGSKWVGEARVVTVHMWNKCPGWLYIQCKLQVLLFLFNYRRQKGLKHTIMWTPKSLKRGQTVFNNQWLTFNFLCQT